jgi:hypothetical protein
MRNARWMCHMQAVRIITTFFLFQIAMLVWKVQDDGEAKENPELDSRAKRDQ